MGGPIFVFVMFLLFIFESMPQMRGENVVYDAVEVSRSSCPLEY